MGLSRKVDHIKPLLRPKSDQQFSHSLCQERTLLYHYALWSTSEHSPCVVRVVWPKRSCTTLPRGVSDGPVSVHVHRDHTHLHSHQSHGWA